ncbi:nestin [Dendrobates tinctorius]|uniref:nestin n=1 Tax=Dendrobates tinctorius TaxID=92724 RepID=UPI003CC95BE2
MSRMETYPMSISDGEESAQMWNLNKRLEAYLSRVKALEEENNLLRAEIHHLKNNRSDKTFIRKYHDEIMTLRDALDDGYREMVQVETDRDSIYQEIEYVKEQCLQEKQAQEDVKRELSESKRLLEEEKRAQIWLKERLFQLEQELEDIFNAHEEEKALMEKEISSYSQRLENFKFAPINFKPVNVEDYANQLSQIWQGAVDEYQNKVSTLEANLSQAKENLKKVVDENKQSQLLLQNLDRDLESLKNQKEMLEGLLTKQWLEQQDEEGRLQLEIETLEKEKQDLRIQIAQVLEDRQQLMHLKMSLSLEVATYRSLLEAESTRLYSPGMDYKMSSSISDLQLEQNAFRKSHHGNTKQLISKDNRINSSRKQSAETPSTKRYLNVKSTSTSNRASPVTKEFQKVSSVLQSQGIKYTKASSAKTAITSSSVASNFRRHPQKGDIIKKNQEETITCSSKSVTKETLAKDTIIQLVVNGNASSINNKELKEIEHMVEFLPFIEKEIVSTQVQSSLKNEGKHIEVNSKFGFEKQNNVVEDQNKDNDTLIVEKPSKQKIDFEAPLSINEGFGNSNKEHIMEKQEIFGQTVTCQRLYVEKQELVEPLVHQNIETPIKVNNEKFRKVLDFSKTNTKDMNETNEPTSDGTTDQGIEYSHSQELEFDNQVSLNNADVDKEVTNHVVHEQKESSQLNKDFQLEESLSCAEATLKDQEVGVVQNLRVLSSSMEDITSLPDDGQNFTKNIYDEQKSDLEQYHVHPKKDTEQVTQSTKIQEYDNKIDQQSYNQVDEILEVDSGSDGKQENKQFDLERKDKFEVRDVSESSSHLSKGDDSREEEKKQEMEDFEEDSKCEETISAEEIIHDSANVKQTRILVVKEVYQSSEQVMDDLEQTLLVSEEEKKNFEFSDLKQILQGYDNHQKTETVEATEEITQNITYINQKESEDQKDNVQKVRNQLSENNLQPGLADFKTVSDTEQERQLENKNGVQTMDEEEGESLLEIRSNSKQEDLYEIVHEETLISNKGKEIHQIEQSNVQPLNVQSTPEHEILSSESEGLDRNSQPLENNPIEEGNIHTCLGELKNSELNDGKEDDKDVIEENYVVCTAVGFTKAIKTEVCVQEEYNIVEEAQKIITQECQLLKSETNVILDEVAGEVLEEKRSFHQDEEESQKNFPQGEAEGKESYDQETKLGQEGYHLKVEEGQEDNLQKVKEEQEHYHQEVKEIPELYHEEVKEEQESYHHEEDKQKGDHQEVEDQIGCEVVSTIIEPVASEEDNKSDYSFTKVSSEEQFVGFSLNIIPNNLRFSSENDAEAQAEQHEHNSKFADKEIKTQKDEKNDLEVECDNFKQKSDGIILEEKEKEQDIFDTEIICQKSTFLLEHQCENVIEDSKSHTCLAKNLTEKYDFDGSIEKHLTDLDAMYAAGYLDYDHSKSEYSMDSQDISICSQKSEECEISKEYQLEQTLPDTTPLPNLDEFEDLAEDETITALGASAEVNKPQSPDDGEAEDTVDSSLESQSSQILSKVSEQSILFKDSDDTEKQDENPKDLCESENPEHVAKPMLDTENSSATPDTVNTSAELCEDLVDSKIYDAKSKIEELKTTPEEVEANKDHLLEKTQFETTFSEDQVELSSKQLSHESVNGVHSEEREERRQTQSEDTNAENVLPETFVFVLSSKHSQTELVPDPSHEDTKENEEHISKEHSDLITNDFGLEQKRTIDIEHHEGDFCKKDTISLPNFDDESENLEKFKIILATEQATEFTKLQIPVDGGEADEVLDSSLESKSSQIFPEVSEQLNLMENNGNDYDYHDQEDESPQDLLESVNPGNFVQPKLNTENYFGTRDTEKLCSKLSSEDKVDNKINEETFEIEKFTTSQEVEVGSLKVHDFETSKDPQLGETQFVTSLSQDQVTVSSEQLANKIVEEDYKEEPKERIITLTEDDIFENVITITLDSAPSSKHSEVDLIYTSSHDDTKENKEYKTKERSDLVTEDFGLEQAKNIDSDDQTRDIPKEDITLLRNFIDDSKNLEDELILATESPANEGEAMQVLERNYGSQLSQNIPEVSEKSNLFKDKDYNEKGESPKELPENKNPDQFEEPKLEAETCSETLDTEESAIVLSGSLESKLDDENFEESTTFQEKVDIFSLTVDEFEEAKDSNLWNIQFETIASEDQGKLLTEKLVSEIVDEDNNEEHDARRITFSEDAKNMSTKTLDFVPSSEHSESELVPDPYLGNKKEEKEHIMKEYSDFLTQDFKFNQAESVDTEEHGEFCKTDTTTLPNPENEFENLETNDILVSEQSVASTKTQSTDKESEVEEALDSSMDSQSSQVLPEVSEQSILFKDDDIDSCYNEQEDDNPKDLLESENPEHVVETKLDAEDSSITPNTKNPPTELSEDSLDNKMDKEKSESEEPTTSREEVAVFSPKDDEFEERNNSQLEKTQFETTSSKDKVQQSSEHLVSESVDEDHNEERVLMLCEDTNRKEELTETYDFIPSPEHSEMELVSDPCLEEKEEHIMKEHSDFIKQDFIPKQTESMNIKHHERDFCKKNTTLLPHDEFKNLESNEILASEQSTEVIKLQSSDDSGDADEDLDSSLESQSSQVLPEASEHLILFKDNDIDPNYNEEQVDCPKDVLESENPEDVVETKLDTGDASVTLDTEKPSADLSENSVNSKMEKERYESEEPTNSPEEVVDFSPKDDEFEGRKDSQLEKTQFQISSEDQVQLSLEQLDNQSVDEDHNEESGVIGLIAGGDTNKVEGIAKISSEHSEMELIPAPCLEDTKESEEHIMKEHSDFVTQDFKPNQTENVNTKDHEVDFCKEDTTSLPNLEEEFEILETDEILASEWSTEVTQLQNPYESGEADEVLDSSLESQSSQIFPEASEHSISFKDEDKDSDYKQGDIPKDLLKNDNPEYFVEAKLDTENSSAILDTEKTSAEPCEYPVGSKVDDEKSEKPTTSQEQVAVFSPKVDEFEGNKDSLLERTQFESSSENQVQLFSEQLVSQSVDKDHKKEPEERILMLSEITNTENVLTKTLDFVPSSEQSETELVSVPCHEDFKYSELVAEDFGLKQTESIDGEGNFCTEETKPLSIHDNKNLEDDKIIIISPQQSAEVSKLQSSADDCEAEEVLDSSLKSHSSQIFPIVSEQSILFKDDDTASDYKEQQSESPKDLLENENPEQFVEPKLETEHSSPRLEAEEPAAQLSENQEDSLIVDEKFKSEEPTTSQEQIAVFLSKVVEFDEWKDSTLEKTQFETTALKCQVQQSSEQLVSENVGEDHNEKLEERRLAINEDTNTEIDLAEILYSVPSSEHSEPEFVPAPGHEDTKEEEEHIMKEHFDLITQDFVLEKKESAKTEDCEKEFFKKDATPLPNLDDETENLKDDEIILASEQSAEITKSQSPDDGETGEVTDSSLASQSSEILPEVNEQSTLFKDEDIVLGYNEQQGEGPKDMLESENPEQFVEPKLENKDSSSTLDAAELAAELSEHSVESKMDGEKSNSEESTTSQVEDAIVSLKHEEFETSKDSHLEQNQTQISPPENQVQLSSEKMVSESIDEEQEEELKEKSLTLDEDTNTDIVLIETGFVLSSEHGQTELFLALSHEDKIENEDYTKMEHSSIVKQDFELEQTESIDNEDHERDVYKEEYMQCDVDLIEGSTKEPSTKSLDDYNEDSIVASNVPDIPKIESEVQVGMTLGTNQEDIKVDVKPPGESSENDESVTSDESSPNVSTISYAHEQQDSSDTDSKISKQAEQNDPLLTLEPVPEGSFMEQRELQTPSDEEKDIVSERIDSSFDSNKEHENISKFIREYSEDGKTMNGIFGHTTVQATLDLDDHMFYGHSTKENHEIIISEAKTFVKLDGGLVNSQSQDKNQDTIIEFTTSERKSEGLFQSLFETSEHKESYLDEASPIKNQTDSAEQSQRTNKLINPYISERDLDDPTEIKSSMMDECFVNTKQEVSEANQGLRISQQEDSWSSDE